MSVQGAHLPPELTTRIAIFTTSPEDFLTFLCICRRWHAAARNAHTVSEWMYQRYRRAALIQITLLAMKSATKEHARQSQTRGQKVEKESDRSTDVGTGTRSQSGRTLLLQSLSCLLRRRFTPPDSHCDWLKVAYQVATLGKATEGLRLDPDVLDRILSHSPDVVHRDTARLALLSSVLKSDLKAVKYLLGLRCVRFADSVLDEVLHMATTKASLYGDTSVLELLLGSRMRDEGAEHEKAGKNTKLFAYSFDTKQLNEALRDNAIPLRGIAAIPLLLDAGADVKNPMAIRRILAARHFPLLQLFWARGAPLDRWSKVEGYRLFGAHAILCEAKTLSRTSRMIVFAAMGGFATALYYLILFYPVALSIDLFLLSLLMFLTWEGGCSCRRTIK